MSPIFPCKGCGTFIERSTQHYRRVKGQVLCSTCSDARLAAEAQGRSGFWQRLLRRFSRLSGGVC
ncbi:MAG: hypothetical protein KXJ49_11800 [Vulcanococcus sp.]|uniref:hypothetical protein n=1 Tax=Vulcanococcus sp. TaxID=2856995 RepID=UPI0025CD92E5|nr:hypothetical protein [Vulcanococcus sp.]MBW0168178.1 hypothetical protein [Vulcanococcus sp.]